MPLKTCTLIQKIALTHDIYELHYKLPEVSTMLPGQFITFIMKWIGGRSYSILELLNWDTAVLVIKKWELSDGWRGGSIKLCDAELWETFQYVWPAGHFLLTDGIKNRLFLWTWTWLVPLYNQILEGLKRNAEEKYQLVFGTRYIKDLYYIEKFEALKREYPDRFYYHLVVSRDEAQWIIHTWYVTDFLSHKVVSQYSEYYICGAHVMIEGCQKKLSELGVNETQTYFEKYS